MKNLVGTAANQDRPEIARPGGVAAPGIVGEREAQTQGGSASPEPRSGPRILPRLPDWHDIDPVDGVLPELGAGGDRLVFWWPLDRLGGYQFWERVGTVGRPDVDPDHGFWFAEATQSRARQRVGGLPSRLAQRFRCAWSGRSRFLPTGAVVEPVGERRTDLVLAWTASETSADEARIRLHWPEARAVERVGRTLYLIRGVTPPATCGPPPEPPQETWPEAGPRQRAEQLLNVARRSGDRLGEASALTDLGASLLREGDARRAVVVLDEAWGVAHQSGDRSRQGDVLIELGLATLAAGDPRRALEVFEQALGLARVGGDRYAEKLALDRLAQTCSALHDPSRALALLEAALAVAREVGDQRHECYLLWDVSIQLSDLGRGNQAVAAAQGAVDLMNALGNPEGAWYADHLRRFRSGRVPQAVPPGRDAWGGTVMATAAVDARLPAPPKGGPSLLRMAVTATEAMAKFVDGGLRILPVEAHRARLDACAVCDQHTGVRCRSCGCFTALKARLPHERCPLNRWPK